MQDDLVNVEINTAQQLELSIDFSEPEEIDPLYQAQVELEKEMRDLAIAKFRESQEKLLKSGSGSESQLIMQMRKKQIGKIVIDMKNNHELLRASIKDGSINGTSPDLLNAIDRMKNIIGYEAMAVIAFNVVVNHLSFGKDNNPFEDLIIREVAKATDFQAFMTYIENKDPRLLNVISRFCLEDKAKQKGKRIKASIEYAEGFGHIDWEWMSDTHQARLGNWLKDRVFYGTRLFESMPVFSTDEKTTRFVVMLTESGEELIEFLEEEACKRVGNSFPMIHKPRDWSRTRVGGYLTPQPGHRSHLVHNHAGTIVSDLAVEALNSLQQVPWMINTYILNVQVELSQGTREIGSFRTYDKESYKIKKPLIENPETAELSWDDAKEDPELLKKKKRAYAIRKQAEQEEKTDAQKTIATKRALEMAYRFSKYERFYMPWYFDNRLRQYCLVDTLNPQGSDNVKAMIMFADGVPKSEASYRDILISLATTFGNGLDKLSYEERIEGAKRMIPVFESVAENPLLEKNLKFWTKADEPFQFLALLNEYFHVFIKCDQTHHFVSSGRDATCSGIQLAGALLRDAKTCRLVNVSPSDTVQDAYKAVADEAIKLMKNHKWMENRIALREQARVQKEEKRLAEDLQRKADGLPELPRKAYVPRDICEIPYEYVDRSVAKMIVMLTPYGGTYPTMLKHVSEKMEKKNSGLNPTDASILTHALIEGMALALPGFSALNMWFKGVAKATLQSGEKQISWVTPSGSVIKQEYFIDQDFSVKTFSYGDTKVDRHIQRKEKSTKEIKTSKMQTALAANTVHSLDASLLQLALHDYEGTSYTTVHDCVYGPSGVLDGLVDRIRTAFYQVVSGDFLGTMLENNGLQDNDGLVTQLRTMTQEDNGLLESIKDSQYIFS